MELAERFPIQAVRSWIGNSEAVASKHSPQFIDEHFEVARRDTAADAAAEKTARNAALSRETRQRPDRPEIPTLPN